MARVLVVELITDIFLRWILPVFVSFGLAAAAFWFVDGNPNSNLRKGVVRFVWGSLAIVIAIVSLYHIQDYSFLKYHFFVYLILHLIQLWFYDQKYRRPGD